MLSRSCTRRACGFRSVLDVDFLSKTTFWKATGLGETFGATVHTSERQHSKKRELCNWRSHTSPHRIVLKLIEDVYRVSLSIHATVFGSARDSG